MATIIDPALALNVALAVRAGQIVRMVSDTSTNWWTNTNGAGWVQVATGVSVFVWTAPTTITRRFTFDDVNVGLGASAPTLPSILVNVFEASPVVLQVTSQWPNDALSEPPATPFSDIHDDPP